MYTKLGDTKNDWTSCIANLAFARILLIIQLEVLVEKSVVHP